MRIQYLARGLAYALLLSSLFTGALCLWCVWSSHQNNKVQRDVARLNAVATVVRSLLADSLEYSKHNPAMVPLLQQFNVLPRGALSDSASAPPGGTRSTSR
jgi:hypothetical protein